MAKKRRYMIEVEGLDDIPGRDIVLYCQQAIQQWGGQWSDDIGDDHRFRIAESKPKVRFWRRRTQHWDQESL